MRQKNAIRMFREMDRMKRRVFNMSDLRKMFPQDSNKALVESINHLVANDILERPTRGVYVYGDTRHPRTHLLYEFARTLRRGCHTYLSLESALSEYGVISQIPMGHHTFMTTGRQGEFRIGHGTIEFTHTSRNPLDFVTDLLEVGRPLPIASMERALIDLRRVGRNVGMLDYGEIKAMRQEKIMYQEENDDVEFH